MLDERIVRPGTFRWFTLPSSLLYSAPPSIAGCEALLQPSRTLRLPDITVNVAAAMMVLLLRSGPPALAAPALAVLTRYCSGQSAMRSPPAGVPGFPLLADGAISIIAAAPCRWPEIMAAADAESPNTIICLMMEVFAFQGSSAPPWASKRLTPAVLHACQAAMREDLEAAIGAQTARLAVLALEAACFEAAPDDLADGQLANAALALASLYVELLSRWHGAILGGRPATAAEMQAAALPAAAPPPQLNSPGGWLQMLQRCLQAAQAAVHNPRVQLSPSNATCAWRATALLSCICCTTLAAARPLLQPAAVALHFCRTILRAAAHPPAARAGQVTVPGLLTMAECFGTTQLAHLSQLGYEVRVLLATRLVAVFDALMMLLVGGGGGGGGSAATCHQPRAGTKEQAQALQAGLKLCSELSADAQVCAHWGWADPPPYRPDSGRRRRQTVTSRAADATSTLIGLQLATTAAAMTRHLLLLADAAEGEIVEGAASSLPGDQMGGLCHPLYAAKAYTDMQVHPANMSISMFSSVTAPLHFACSTRCIPIHPLVHTCAACMLYITIDAAA